MELKTMKKIEIWTDGSCLGNPGKGGYCGILQYRKMNKIIEKIVKGYEQETTNNRMELKAVIESLKALKEPCHVKLYSDSQYVIHGIQKYLERWILKNFSGIKNPDLWREYMEISKDHYVEVEWVKAHSGIENNERADKIARVEMANKV